MKELRSHRDLIDLLEVWGVVPFFRNALPGFSVEEFCPPELWFTDRPGPWEWKGPVIREAGAAYGKFFRKKAAWVRRDLFFHFANFRRDGYDFDARFDDGLASLKEKKLYDLAAAHGPALSTRLRAMGGYGARGKGEFESVSAALQSEGYLLCHDFVYSLDKKGRPYGWGVAELATPEAHYGEDFARAVYKVPPAKSGELLTEAVLRAVPGIGRNEAERFIKG